MELDHVSYASEKDGHVATAARIAEKLGILPYDGGVHPRFGTRNLIFPLADGRYIEVVEALEHPAALGTPFGQVVRARSESGGGWMGWVVRVDDLAPVETRLGREAVEGNRTPEGRPELRWKQIGVKGTLADPQLPFFVHWLCPSEEHPSAPNNGQVRIESLQIAGNRDRLRDWLGTDEEKPISDTKIDWVAPNGTPGVLSVTFETPKGLVTI